MDSKRKIMVIVMVILIILILLLVFLLINSLKNENSDENVNYTFENSVGVNNQDDISTDNQITNTEIYKARDCISIYLSAINKSNPVYYGTDSNGNLVQTITNEAINENIYPLLSQNYIQNNNITTSNLDNYIDDISSNAIFDILEIKRYMNNNSYQYAIYGILTDTDNNFIKFAYYNVFINLANNVFAIEPILSNVNSLDEVAAQDVVIEKNDYNDIPINNLTQEGVLREVLNTYKRLMLAKPDLAYEYLNSNYRNQKFGDLNGFTNYINNNREQLSQVRLSQYSYTDYDSYTQLICVDQNGHYYIFDETEPTQYEVILDTYTIDLPQFTEQYNSASEERKVQLNIQRFFDSLSDGDYKYAYSKLDETYKNNNFPTQTDFENYVKTNFYNKNTLGYKSYEKNGDVYVYRMVITNGDDETQTIEKQFVVKLLDGTDFVMSFEK